MALFDNYETKLTAFQRASLYLHYARQAYAILKAMQQLKADYQAGTDTTLVAAVNAIHPPAERTDLGAMQTTVDALLTDWETLHREALALP